MTMKVNDQDEKVLNTEEMDMSEVTGGDPWKFVQENIHGVPPKQEGSQQQNQQPDNRPGYGNSNLDQAVGTTLRTQREPKRD